VRFGGILGVLKNPIFRAAKKKNRRKKKKVRRKKKM
jgi:hypothetical protein